MLAARPLIMLPLLIGIVLVVVFGRTLFASVTHLIGSATHAVQKAVGMMPSEKEQEEWIADTVKEGEQRKDGVTGSNSAVNSKADKNQLGWVKEFKNGVTVGLRFHYPNKQAAAKYKADRFLIFIRSKGDTGKAIFDRLNTGALSSAIIYVEDMAAGVAGDNIRPVFGTVRRVVGIVESIASPLMSVGNTMTSAGLSVMNAIIRPFVGGAAFDPATELEQAMPTHKTTSAKSLWIPTQGTVHFVTLIPKTKSATEVTDQEKVYELSFDFPPNKVKGASDLINPQIPVDQKAAKAVRLVVESVVSIPIVRGIAGNLSERVVAEIVGSHSAAKASAVKTQ